MRKLFFFEKWLVLVLVNKFGFYSSVKNIHLAREVNIFKYHKLLYVRLISTNCITIFAHQKKLAIFFIFDIYNRNYKLLIQFYVS